MAATLHLFKFFSFLVQRLYPDYRTSFKEWWDPPPPPSFFKSSNKRAATPTGAPVKYTFKKYVRRCMGNGANCLSNVRSGTL